MTVDLDAIRSRLRADVLADFYSLDAFPAYDPKTTTFFIPRLDSLLLLLADQAND